MRGEKPSQVENKARVNLRKLAEQRKMETKNRSINSSLDSNLRGGHSEYGHGKREL